MKLDHEEVTCDTRLHKQFTRIEEHRNLLSRWILRCGRYDESLANETIEFMRKAEEAFKMSAYEPTLWADKGGGEVSHANGIS
jgi:hypothetical protein